jgi:hypothetical protein
VDYPATPNDELFKLISFRRFQCPGYQWSFRSMSASFPPSCTASLAHFDRRVLLLQSGMLFRSSDLTWWAWLLNGLLTSTIAVGCWVIFSLHYDQRSTARRSFAWLAFVVSIPAALIGGISALMGLILFVKWVWTSA